jgi:hypothetical protein
MENRWKNNQDNSDDGSNSSSNMQIYFKVLWVNKSIQEDEDKDFSHNI